MTGPLLKEKKNYLKIKGGTERMRTIVKNEFLLVTCAFSSCS